MQEYGFLLILLILDSVLIRENAGQWKPLFLHILYSVRIRTHYNAQDDARVKTVECNNKHYMNEAATSSLTQSYSLDSIMIAKKIMS